MRAIHARWLLCRVPIDTICHWRRMDLFIELALSHICRDPNELVNPQFRIGGDDDESVFLAVNTRRKDICVVVIDTAAEVEALVAKINDYENQWLGKLKETQQLHDYFEDGYHFHIKVFLRQDVAENLRDVLTIHPKDIVQIRSFEEIGYPWEWEESK